MESIDDIKKVSGHRKPSVTGAYKISNIYHLLKRNGSVPKHISLKQFGQIIRTMGKNLMKLVMDGYIVRLPANMGEIGVVQQKPKVRFVDGVVKTGQMIDWGTTVKLWSEDEEARRDKTIVRYTADRTFRAVHYIQKAKYRNKYFFVIRINSTSARAIPKYADENNITYHKT